MDWGLLQPASQHFLLRDELVFRRGVCYNKRESQNARLIFVFPFRHITLLQCWTYFYDLPGRSILFIRGYTRRSWDSLSP